MRIQATMIAAALLTSGCAATTSAPPAAQVAAVEVQAEPEWRRLASAEDIDRLTRTDAAWAAALEQIRAGRFTRALREEGELLEPEAALPRPDLPPGSYHCRLLRISQGDRRRPPVVSFRPFYCHVADAGEQLAFTKQTGSERPAGYFYRDEQRGRLVFLGTLTMGSGEPAPYDGSDPRDMIGVVERVGPFRWRLVLPWPRSGATLEVMELVPALP